MAAALQKLESDYNQMRQEILTGVPLEQLRPLCVDLTEGSCIPSQVRTAAVIQVQVPPPAPPGGFSQSRTHSCPSLDTRRPSGKRSVRASELAQEHVTAPFECRRRIQ